MKKIIIVLILLLQVIFVSSQSNSILHQKNLWSVLHESSVVYIHPDDSYPFIKTTWYKIGKDTIIEEIAYKKLLSSTDSLMSTWSYTGSVRENENKVYYFNGASEILLYNFDLSKNDTLDLFLQSGIETNTNCAIRLALNNFRYFGFRQGIKLRHS